MNCMTVVLLKVLQPEFVLADFIRGERIGARPPGYTCLNQSSRPPRTPFLALSPVAHELFN